MVGLLIVALSASAATPTFTLDRAEVALTLPEGAWRLVRWSADTLQVLLQRPGPDLRLDAWWVPVQVPVTEAEAWAAVFEHHVVSIGGAPGAAATELRRLESRSVAYVDLPFVVAGGPARGLRGATLEVAGGNLHVAVSGPDGAAREAADLLAGVLAGLAGELPPSGTYEATIETPGAVLRLPVGWRPELEVEDVVTVGPDADCTTALAPRAAAPPGQLAICHEPLGLGVVDEHTFRFVEPTVRAALFEGSVPPGEPASVDDQLGFRFRLSEDRIVTVVPHVAGALRLDLRAPDADDLEQLMGRTQLGGPHPASLGDWLWYWLWVRPTSLPVLALAAAFAGGGLAIRLTRRAREPSE